MNEAAPTQGIVDAETFVSWTRGYVSDVIPGDSSNRRMVHLRDCPWTDVPENLRQVIYSVYDAALVDGDKKIDIRIDPNAWITFQLRSESVRLMQDTYGENWIGTGPRLILYDIPEGNRKRADWVLSKVPIGLIIQMDNIFNKYDEDEEFTPADRERIHQIMNSDTEVKPATLEELRDLARFLERSRERAVVNT